MPVLNFFKHFRLPAPEKRSNIYISNFTLFIVTALMFGSSIWFSTDTYLSASVLNINFSEDSQQLIELYKLLLPLLTAAVVYLYIMAGFSVRDLPWGISWQATLLGVFLFVLLVVLADIFFVIIAISTAPTTLDTVHGAASTTWSAQLWLATILHAVFNGIYEELYFLGIVLAVRRRWLWVAIVLSLIVRFSVHTYQGLEAAFIITAMGLQMLILYYWIRRLWPFMVAHMLADIFGLSLLYYLQ